MQEIIIIAIEVCVFYAMVWGLIKITEIYHMKKMQKFDDELRSQINRFKQDYLWQISLPRKRYKEEACLTTKCEMCGREFMTSKKVSFDKMPWKCSGCGNDLTWSIPYTRLEIDYTDGRLLECKNVLHRRKWEQEIKWHIWDVMEVVLDESVAKVEIRVKKEAIH